MSRIGNKPIALPAGVDVNVAGTAVNVKGPKGQLKVDLPAGLQIEKKDGRLHAVREGDSLSALHGLIRSLLANAVTESDPGVSEGARDRRDRLPC